MNKKRKKIKIETAKLPYIPIKFDVTYVKLEQGIAAGSAGVNPGGNAEPVKEEWETGINRDNNFDW